MSDTINPDTISATPEIDPATISATPTIDPKSISTSPSTVSLNPATISATPQTSPDDKWLNTEIKNNHPGWFGFSSIGGAAKAVAQGARLGWYSSNELALQTVRRAIHPLSGYFKPVQEYYAKAAAAVAHNAQEHPQGSVYSTIGSVAGNLPVAVATWGSGGKYGELASTAFYGLEGFTAHKNQTVATAVRDTVMAATGRAMMGRLGLAAVPMGRINTGLVVAGGSALVNSGLGEQNTWGGLAAMGIIGMASGRSLGGAEVGKLVGPDGKLPNGQPANIDSMLAFAQQNDPELFDRMNAVIRNQAIHAGYAPLDNAEFIGHPQSGFKHPVTVTHFSPKSDLTSVSPDFAESNPSQKGAERGRYSTKFSHFYGGNESAVNMESGLGSTRYEGLIEGDGIFDAKNPEDAGVRDNYYANLPGVPQSEKSRTFINNLSSTINPRTGKPYIGFKGGGGTIGMFHDVPVKPVPFSPKVAPANDQAANAVYAMQTRGGFSHNLANGYNMSGQDAYAVGMFPERGVALDHEPTASEMSDYINKNNDILSDPRTMLGGWHDSGKDEKGNQVRPESWQMDVSVPVRNEAKAKELGARYHQISIYNLKSGKELPTGGDGKQFTPETSPEERLAEVNKADPVPQNTKQSKIFSFLRQRQEQATQQSMLSLQLETAAETMRSFTVDEQRAFNEEYIQTGKVSDLRAQTAYNQYRSAMESQKAFEEKYGGIVYPERKNYIPGIYKAGPAGELEPFAGSGGPMMAKQKVFLSPAEAESAGFIPYSHNIGEIGQMRVTYGSLQAGKGASMADAQRAGLATTDIESAPKHWKSTIAGGKMYRVDPMYLKYYDRAWKSARFDPAEHTEATVALHKVGAAVFRYTMKVKAGLTYTLLSLSAFHGLHIIHIDANVAAADALESGLRPTADVLATTSRAMVGKDIIESFKPYDQMSPSETTVADMMALMGVTPGRPTITDPRRVQMTVESVLDDTFSGFPTLQSKGPLGSPAVVLANVFRHVTAGLQKPLFEELIPSLKANASVAGFVHMVTLDPSLLDNTPESTIRLRKAATELGSQIDFRYGEMQYNRYLWHPMIKNAAFGYFLSVGWNAGFVHEFGGGALDLGKALTNPSKYPITNRAIYAATYLTTAALITGSMSYLLTGQAPTVESTFYIRLPASQGHPHGSYESTMFFNREISGAYYHYEAGGLLGGAEGELGNKAAPIWSPVIGLIRNADFFGNQIYDPNAPLEDQILQSADFIGKNMLPISFGPVQKGDAEPGAMAESMSGFNPAPGFVEHAGMYEDIINQYSLTHGAEITPYSNEPGVEARRHLDQVYKQGGFQGKDFSAAMVAYLKLHPTADPLQIAKELTAPEGASMFTRLSPGQQIEIFRKYGPLAQDLIPFAAKSIVMQAWSIINKEKDTKKHSPMDLPVPHHP